VAARLRAQHQDDIKDKIRAAQLVKLLQDHALTNSRKKKRIDPTRIKAAEILLARSIPILSSVDQTINDARDSLSEAQVLAELQGVFTAKPELLDRLIQLRDAARLVQEGADAVSQVQQNDAPPAKSEATSA